MFDWRERLAQIQVACHCFGLDVDRRYRNRGQLLRKALVSVSHTIYTILFFSPYCRDWTLCFCSRLLTENA